MSGTYTANGSLTCDIETVIRMAHSNANEVPATSIHDFKEVFIQQNPGC